MIRKTFVLIGALALVIASAVPVQARPTNPTGERGPRVTERPVPTPQQPARCTVAVEIPGRTKVRTCPDGQIAVYSWDSKAGWVLVYARLAGRR